MNYVYCATTYRNDIIEWKEGDNVAEWTKEKAIQYKNEFIKEKYDRFNLTFPKGKKDEYQNLAKTHGMSLNALINQLLEDYAKKHQ